MQPEAFGQLAAHLRIAELDVAVGNGLPVITYAIVDQMAMGMGAGRGAAPKGIAYR